MRIKQPTLIVDQYKVLRNIERIATKATASHTALWPHFKTHQSAEIGNWFKKYGVKGITVSSVTMARYFAEAGWLEIYIAFPLNVNEIDEIVELANLVNLTVLINDKVQLDYLISNLTATVKVKIEIETGSQRSGILPSKEEDINILLGLIKNSEHFFDGFYSHFGHTYAAKDIKEVNSIFKQSFDDLIRLKERFSAFEPHISLGDTPTASVLATYEQIKSMHAGNYVFYDLTQAEIGVCAEEDIAVALAVPVVSKNASSKELVVYGGGIHLSKESLQSNEFERPIFGKVVDLGAQRWSTSLRNCYVRSISQEHGVIKVTDEVFLRYNIGDSLGILPVHSCMTADCMGGYYTLNWEKIDHLRARL